jgi:HlyD family secretion protein
MSPDKQTLDELRIDRTAPRRRSPVILLITVAAAVAVAVAVMGWVNRPRALAVRTAVVEEVTTGGGDRTLLNASGYVTARREATVSAKVTGRVVEVLVEEGMHVEANQVLARLDPSNVENSLRLAEAQLESARQTLDETRANIELAERELRRIDQLARQGIASQSDRD